MKIEVIYHKDGLLPIDPLGGVPQVMAQHGTVGIKFTYEGRQYGAWDFLPMPHTPGDVFRKLMGLSDAMAANLDSQEIKHGT